MTDAANTNTAADEAFFDEVAAMLEVFQDAQFRQMGKCMRQFEKITDRMGRMLPGVAEIVRREIVEQLLGDDDEARALMQKRKKSLKV